MIVADVAHGHAVIGRSTSCPAAMERSLEPRAQGRTARPCATSALLLVGLFAILSPASRAQTQLDLTAPEVMAQGEGLFAQSCAVGYCHGSAGRAARGPELRNRRWSPQDLYRITHDGLNGTSMPAWKGILSDHDIWAITGYILSLSGQPPDGPTRVEVGAGQAPKPELGEAAKRGRALFFDLDREKRCSLCHRIGNWGRAIGPNLAQAAAGKSVAELTASIHRPQSTLAFGFQQTIVETTSGETISGILRGEEENVVRIYDTSVLPPALRTFYSGQFTAVNESRRSSMPSAAELGYSDEEVATIVAYLREL